MSAPRFLLLMACCALAGWAGVSSALRQIPPDERRPPSPLPPGSTFVLATDVHGAANARDLRDWHFARENNISIPALIESGRVVSLEQGSNVTILQGDLDLVRVSVGGAGAELWMRAVDVDPNAAGPKDPQDR